MLAGKRFRTLTAGEGLKSPLPVRERCITGREAALEGEDAGSLRMRASLEGEEVLQPSRIWERVASEASRVRAFCL
jgi:hypothetical protein